MFHAFNNNNLDKTGWKLIGIFILSASCVLHAQHNKDVQRADAYFAIGKYADAAMHYEFACRRKLSAYNLEKLSDCYLKLDNHKKAEAAILKLRNKFTLSDKQRLKYAYLLKHNGKIKEAKKELFHLYNNCDSSLKSNYLLQIASCDSLSAWNARPANYVVFNIKEINSIYADISPVSYNDSMVFASNRQSWKIQPKSFYDKQPFFDIYIASIDYKWKATKPKKFSSVVNTASHESSASFTDNGNKIYFTRSAEVEYEADSVKRMKLYASEKINSKWMKPHTFIFNDSAYSFAHPCIEKDDKMIFFASDMKGGFGGTDIYVSIQVEDSIWSDPINLGPVINTPGNENYPFYHSDGSLYFASDYHIGMGGYDIFIAKQKNGTWLNVVNIKPPINSTYDDISIFFNPTKSFGYFSSNRPGGKGKEDIYLIRRKY